MSTQDDHNVQPTPYPEVNALVSALLREVRATLGAEFVGLYLYGSLSLGDFDLAGSDVDFLVVTRGVLPPATLDALGAMHARLAASGLPWAEKLEGSYWPRAALRRHDPDDARHPTIGIDWPFGVGDHGTKFVIERQIIREGGIAVAGPPPRDLIDPVPPDDLRAAVRALLRDFWARQLDGPDWLRPRAYQAFAVLTICRALHTLATGTVVSKPVAAAWAAANFPQWAGLIDRALGWRHDHCPDEMGEMLAFVRWAVERAARDAG